MEIIFKFNRRDSWPYILLKNVLLLFCVGSFYITSYVQMCNAQDDLQLDLHLCNNNNYTNAKTFESNLNTVLNNLVRHTSSSGGFSTSVSGQSPDQVFGLLQCRGDVSVEECYNCSTDAITAIRESCGNAVGGKVWLPKCFVRYENYNFIGVLDMSYPDAIYNRGRPTDPEAFGKAVRELLTNLSDAAPSPDSPHPEETPADSPPSTQSKTTSKKSTILGIFGGLLLILLAGLFAIRGKVTSTIFGNPVLHGSLYEGDRHEVSLINRDEHIIFKLETLIAATANFHENNKLGEGGFGTVYKGIMPDGKEVAVKKLSLKSTQGRKEFLNEVKLVAKVQHRNLVNLFGCCAEGFERLLVYEYLPNRSLDKILFDPQRVTQLDWQKRSNIIIGIARGLMYLHEDSQMRIIHRDIKPSNILLDGKMNSKIADFGLARLFPEDETHVNTRVAGTYGYMAPEYAMHGQLSVKADVYSFGVVLLEIVCGRKNTDFKLSLDFQSLLEIVWISYSKGNIVDVIDRAIVESCPHEQAFRCVHVGLLCTQADASLRPLMSSVYSMLANPTMINLPDATMPAFVNVTHNNAQSHTSGSTTSTSISISTSSGTPVVHPQLM